MGTLFDFASGVVRSKGGHILLIDKQGRVMLPRNGGWSLTSKDLFRIKKSQARWIRTSFGWAARTAFILFTEIDRQNNFARLVRYCGRRSQRARKGNRSSPSEYDYDYGNRNFSLDDLG